MKKLLFILLIILLLLVPIFSIQNNNNNSNIDKKINKGLNLKFQIKPKPKISIFSFFSILKTLTQNPNEKKYYILEFNNKVNNSQKKELENLGVKFHQYIPYNSYIVQLKNGIKKKVKAKSYVLEIYEYLPEYKISKSILNKPNQNLNLIIQTFNETNLTTLKNKIKSNGGKIIIADGKNIILNINTNNLNFIIKDKNVLTIDEYYFPKILNNVARNITNVNTIWQNYSLYGTGQIITVADTGLDIGVNNASIHPDFKGRILQIVDFWGIDGANDDDGHGTHVAGSVLGNGNMSGSDPQNANYENSFAGVAPNATLYFQALENGGGLFTPADLNNLFQPAYNNGSRIHTNSWGSTCGGNFGTYSTNSVNVDTFIWNNKDMIILFASGNNGNDSNSDGVINSDSIFCPATAKNVISIGASESVRSSGGYSSLTWGGAWPSDFPANPIFSDLISNNSNGIAGFSARGPTDDGRIKPDLVAPGTDIISVRSQDSSAGTGWGVYNSNYIYEGGTSMATPISAGITALVREHVIKNWNYSSPSAALIKGLLINGAFDMTPGQYGTGATQEVIKRFDNSQGWGRIDLKNSILPDSPKKIFYVDNQTGLNTNETYTYKFTISKNVSNIPLRVSLVYSDYPGTTFTTPNLVNDLDLNMTDSYGNKYYGNNVTTGDFKNNVEGIDILNPLSGDYEINIFAYNVPQGPQPFALIVSYDANNTKPIITINNPINNSIYSNNSILLNITTNENTTTKFSLNGNSNITFNSTDNLNFLYNLTNLTDGIFNLKIYSTSNFNLSNLKEIKFIIDVNKTIATINSPINDSTYYVDNLLLNITTNENATINFSLNGNNNISINSSNNRIFVYNLTNLNAGIQNLSIYSTDIYNQTSFKFINFTINLVLPTANIISPYDNYQLNTSTQPILNIAGNFSKNISYLEYTIDGSTINVTDKIVNNSKINFTINLSGNGDKNLSLYFKDINNLTNTKNISFTVNLNPANVTINSPLNITYNITNLKIPLVANFSRNIDFLVYSINGVYKNISSNIINDTINTSIDILNFGQNSIRINYTDLYGVSTSKVLDFNTSLFFNGSTSYDLDGDNINDSLDKVKGNSSNVNTDISNFLLKINSSNNLSQVFNSTLNVTFYNGTNKIVEFENNFSTNSIDLTNVTLKESSVSNSSKILIRGLKLGSGKTKSVYIDLTGDTNKFGSLCIKDKEIFDFNEISSSCTGTNETYIKSVPLTVGNYNVILENSRIKISGLTHSAIAQTCTENWVNGSWSSCSSSSQTMSVSDSNSCGTTNVKPVYTQSCTSSSSTSPSTGGGGGGVSLNTTSTSFVKKEKIITPQITSSRYDLFIGNDKITNSKTILGFKKIEIKNKLDNVSIIEFDYNFSKSQLDLGTFETIYDFENVNKPYIIVRGLKEEINKSLRLYSKSNNSKICIKDLDINSINDISNSCKNNSEYLLNCNGVLEFNKYTCLKDGDYYLIKGLSHSGVYELKNVSNNNNPNINLNDSPSNNISNEVVSTSNNLLNSNVNLSKQNNSTIQNSTFIKKLISVSNEYIMKNIYLSISISIVILFFIFFSIYILIQRKKLNDAEKDYEKIYEEAKEYIRKYNNEFPTSTLIYNLEKANFPKEIISSVINEINSKNKK